MTVARASQACSHAGCPELKPCPAHKPKSWSRGKRLRRSLVRPGAAKRRRFVLARDQEICYVCGGAGADMADHVIPLGEGGPDDVFNMGAIHSKPCHAEKTQREARRGEARMVR